MGAGKRARAALVAEVVVVIADFKTHPEISEVPALNPCCRSEQVINPQHNKSTTNPLSVQIIKNSVLFILAA